MSEKKYKITSISGNSRYAGEGGRSGDEVADTILRLEGFVDRSGRSDRAHLFMGCVPAKDKSFIVYHNEPELNSTDGWFRLVRIEPDGSEIEIDHGKAGKSHGDPGIRTFYGKGKELASWSFHCDPNPLV